MATGSTNKVSCMYIVASLAGALVVAMAVLRLQQNATRKQENEDDDDDYDWNNDDETKAFPWEPKSNQHSNYSFPEKKINVNNHRQEQKELDFLSSMSFANGGLRAPNCLCCL